MISTAGYAYPVSDQSSARRVALQPHIYSPSESRNSPRVMYPPLQAATSPSPNYVYVGYDPYYPKDNWVTATPSSWPTFYPLPRSLSLPETTLNPKVIVHPPQPADIHTPSSISSHSILTPSSPFSQHEVDQADLHAMDFDKFDGDEDVDDVDSDFDDEMEGIDEDASSPLYGASASHVNKSTSALEGALGDTPSASYDTHLGVFSPADRRLSASVPGYPNASHRSTAGTHQRWTEAAHSPASQLTSSSSTSLFTPTSPPPAPASSLPLYTHTSSSSLAGAFASTTPSPHASRPTSNPLPILQPQPIRPIPPIPLAELASSANEHDASPEPRPRTRSSRTLSPLPLLCQPVSDAVLYQLKERSASGGASDDACYKGNASMCHPATEAARFAPHGLTFCQEHQTTAGPCSVAGRLYSCGSMPMPIRWH